MWGTSVPKRKGLDGKDAALIAALQLNARGTYEDLAKHIGLTANAVRARLSRLLGSGHIAGFTAQMGRSALRPAFEAFVDLEFERLTGAEITALEERLIAMPTIAGAWIISGAQCIRVHLASDDRAAVRHLETTLSSEGHLVRIARTDVIVDVLLPDRGPQIAAFDLPHLDQTGTAPSHRETARG
jgi:Lrp/AsnC family transcriptional regulator, leucine-responsive regulatory protein